MKQSYIYVIECISNCKKYIGQTVNLRKRWMEHKRTLNLNSHHSTLLQEDWNIYGEKDFKHTVLCECNINDVDERERYFISQYKSNNLKYGYNLCNGGNKNKTHHEKTRELLRHQAVSSGRWKGKNNPNFGGVTWDDERRKYYQELNKAYWTKDAKKKHSEKMKTAYNFDAALEAVRESVIQLDFNGEFIAEYSSVTEASAKTDISKPHISSCCNEKRASCGGYVWVKKEKYKSGDYKIRVTALAKNKTEKLVKLSLDGVYLDTFYYKDIKGNHKARIIDCCNGLAKSARGFSWMRYDDYINKNQQTNTEVN